MTGRVRGNVLLRRKQYQVSMNQDASLTIARNCILGKVYNARWVLERAVRDHGLQIDTEKVKEAAGFLKQSLRRIEESRDMAQLRGYEGEDAGIYLEFSTSSYYSRKRISISRDGTGGRLWIM